MNNIIYHQFDINLAQKLSIEAAIIFHNICYWIEKNKANRRHFYEGRFWTYNSVTAFSELFPYMSRHAINKALKDLESEGYLVSGNFNESSYDRTKWFSANQQFHLSKNGNGMCENQKPIPDSKPDINTNSKQEENQQKAETLETNLEEEFFSEPLETPEEKKEKSCAKKEKEIFEYYNANRNQMQEAEILSDQRKQSIRVRLKDYGEEKVKQVINKASKSDFLNGLVEGRDFKAGFDWIFKPSNFVKILEGNYDNKPQKQDGNTKNRIRNR
ncbi:hypothetical protein [Elizabethkingia anophelis]|uniref:hypothetical protein n=1 Tax=Elizabethkingia anophelis TaxID=1117645 RepID=UPI0023EA3161|nr:hypothetical protein [Elizabethkingia anophelis]GJN60490.1 hypothetical protein ELAK_06400 [Elizabethkingia anophelis]HDP3253983.1 hypothetical protein [Elizabethkingia anophelis]